MKKTNIASIPMPNAFIGINKSRVKSYKDSSDITKIYLEKNSEFQIELNNPTRKTILAKIKLNEKYISNGGIVLRPGQTVWLDRYLDSPNKFLFDTYEVSNTQTSKEAIVDNGNFLVEFYNESEPQINYGFTQFPVYRQPYIYPYFQNNDYMNTYTYNSNNLVGSVASNSSNEITLDSLGNTSCGGNYSRADRVIKDANPITTNSFFSKQKKSLGRRGIEKQSLDNIETGTVEKGSISNQKLTEVDKSFDYFPFQTVKYKLLPVSQKISTSEDLGIKRYCVSCGAKLKKEYKYCPACATKV